MRGDREQSSINRIKRFLFCDKMQQPYVYQNKDVYELTDDEYKKYLSLYTNLADKRYYGLLQEDAFEIFNAIRNSNANPEKSKFPDFLVNKGFIEHFQITASKETKNKGATEMISQKKFDRERKEELEEFYKYCNENPCYDSVRSKEWKREELPEYSYENLKNSIKNNLTDHLISYNKYQGAKDLSIFLIENDEVNLEMIENTLEHVKKGVRCDYPIRQEYFPRYMLSRDKEMLNYFYELRNKIKYVIYEYVENFEIIKVENIPEMLKFIPNNYLIVPRNIQIIHKVMNVSKKINLR